MSKSPYVSIVMPTYNRQARLARVLDALDRQQIDAGAFEVVIVDDGSTDGTASYLAAQRRAYALRAIHQTNSGPARARNAAVAESRAELLLFLDDDVEPSQELVSEHLASHEREKDVVVMGPMASLKQYRQAWVAWEQAKLEEQYAAMIRGDWEPTFRQFWTGNASVAREHVQAAGGFNPDFLRAEDVELGYRLHSRGLKFRFNPRALGLHHAERSLSSWELMHRRYGELEVKIFGMWDDAALITILAKNWRGLHPATRWLVRQSLGKPRRYEAFAMALRGWLKAEAKLDRSVLSDKVCGAFANLIYWQASVDALGSERADQVFRRAEELSRGSA
jgi:glycosyltransferase involved in cell wall biosynthesis